LLIGSEQRASDGLAFVSGHRFAKSFDADLFAYRKVFEAMGHGAKLTEPEENSIRELAQRLMGSERLPPGHRLVLTQNRAEVPKCRGTEVTATAQQQLLFAPSTC
jgi:hypothetical protein